VQCCIYFSNHLITLYVDSLLNKNLHNLSLIFLGKVGQTNEFVEGNSLAT
jgi:hypothetical protein